MKMQIHADSKGKVALDNITLGQAWKKDLHRGFGDSPEIRRLADYVTLTL